MLFSSLVRTMINGVGFIIRSKITRSLSSIQKAITDCIMTLAIEIANSNSVVLVSCHAPALYSSEAETGAFYDQLKNSSNSSHFKYSLPF